jgi:hypothetical protein
VFLDENMPGMTEGAARNEREKKSAIPMIMITKVRKSTLWREAMGSKITADT